METNLSLSFESNATYIAVLEKREIGLHLKYLDIANPIDIENIQNPFFKENLDKLLEKIKLIPHDYHFVNISIPLELTFVTQFFSRPNFSKAEVLSLVNIEIRQIFPQYNPEHFPTYVFRLRERKNNPFFLAVIIPKKIYENIKLITSSLKKLTEKIEINHINAQNALLYNYPENKNDVIGLFNIQENFIDFSLFINNEIISYNLLKYSSAKDLPQQVFETIGSTAKEFNINFDGIFLCGNSLTRTIFENIKAKLSAQIRNVKRLNALRMVTTEIDSRTREIAAKIAHILPSCIGACIPSYFERFKFI